MGLLSRLTVAVRAFQASKSTAHYTPPRDANFSPDGSVQDAGVHLRAWGRHFEENHDIAVGVLDELVDQVVGRGIVIEPMVLNANGTPAEAVNSTLTEIIDEWAESPDVTGQLNWAECQRLTCRAWFRDGDHFTHHVQGMGRGYEFEPGRIPYAVELVEADRVPLDMNDRKNDPRILQGVQIDQWHRPRAYYVYEEEVGASAVRFSPVATAGWLARTKPIPAEQMTHLAFRRRFPQVRGVSIFAPATRRMHDLHDYDESERIAARANSRVALWLQRDESYQAPNTQDAEREIVLPQGSVFDDMAVGESINSFAPNRPNQNLNEFRQGQLRAVAAGTHTRYSAIARDYNGTYSSQRQELVEAAHGYRPLTEFFISRVIRPQYQRLIETALLTGRLAATGLTVRQLARAEFIGPAIPWIDPAKEVAADVSAIDNDLATREQIIRRRGGDPRKIPMRERHEQQTAPATRTPAPDPQDADD